MAPGADDICPQHGVAKDSPTHPAAPAIQLSSVWQCTDIDQAGKLLAGEIEGYVYRRDGHPNADAFAAKCKALHHADHIAVAASGMSAMALALLSQSQHGDHLLISDELYGASTRLLTSEAARLGIETTQANACDPAAFEAALQPNTRMAVIETIGNPRLSVPDIASLADITKRNGTLLLVDNTFATPVLCQPLTLGADLVLESVSKMMNGHSDVMLGLLAGVGDIWQRAPGVLSTWGLTASPFDCYLAQRGLSTLALRMHRACDTALQAARLLQTHSKVEHVDYPGLSEHPQHRTAAMQFNGLYGSVCTFRLAGGHAAAGRFVEAAEHIPFCPSLGEVCTTLSHPASTSHRNMTPQQQQASGITGSVIRLSAGIESTATVLQRLEDTLAAV